MALTPTQLKDYTDHLGQAYALLLEVFGVSTGTPTDGSIRELAFDAREVIADSGDWQLEEDMNTAIGDAYVKSTAPNAATYLGDSLTSLSSHLAARGPTEIDATVVSLDTYLAYLNSTAYTVLLSSEFAQLMLDVGASTINPLYVMSPSISPLTDATTYPNGLGTRAVGGAYTDGAEVDTIHHTAVEPLLVVTVDFADGGADPAITVAGLRSDTGVSGNWTVTLDSNNPVAAVATTITPAVTAHARQTVAIASASGIVRGSVLTVNDGDDDEETIIVEVLSGTNLTAVFRKAHTAGADLTGFRTYVLTPPAANVRTTDVTDITITIDTHSAGTVRVDGRRDRVPV